MSRMETARRRPPSRMTTADFIDWPGDGTAKTYQLVDGEPRAMPPASATHGLIQMTLGSLIRNRLLETGSPCRVVTEPAVVPRLRANANLRVPDLGVTCTPIRAGQIELPEPVLLVEILSPGNEPDAWENVWAYASIPSVQEILIVQSTRIGVELLRRRPDRSWPEEPEGTDAKGTLRLETIDFTCPVLELYVGTHLA
jgi:Uma2 family endonuclease